MNSIKRRVTFFNVMFQFSKEKMSYLWRTIISLVTRSTITLACDWIAWPSILTVHSTRIIQMDIAEKRVAGKIWFGLTSTLCKQKLIVWKQHVLRYCWIFTKLNFSNSLSTCYTRADLHSTTKCWQLPVAYLRKYWAIAPFGHLERAMKKSWSQKTNTGKSEAGISPLSFHNFSLRHWLPPVIMISNWISRNINHKQLSSWLVILKLRIRYLHDVLFAISAHLRCWAFAKDT